MFYSGISGLQLPTPRYQMDAEHHGKSRLEIYAGMFNSIEINSSFYKIPIAKTVSKWSASVDKNFRFTFKLFKEITHVKRLEFNPATVHIFLDALQIPILQRGSLLIQLPPSMKADNLTQLGDLLHTIHLHDPQRTWEIAVEFRSSDWYNDHMQDLLRKHSACVVMHDKPGSVTPKDMAEQSDCVYLRFHGPTGNYRGSYDEHFLEEYAEYITSWLSERKTVYAYFNNTMGDAVRNLITLNRLINVK